VTICCAGCDRGPFSDGCEGVASSSLGALDPDAYDWCPFPVWPSDVDRLKARLDPAFVESNAQAIVCFEGVELTAWRLFYAAWEAYRTSRTDIFGAPSQCKHGADMARDLNQWRARMREKGCGEPTSPDPSAVGGNAGQTTTEVVKWIAIGTVAVGVVYGLTLLAPVVRK
jgi:hypothetical protein